jgi:hypothetical protein
MVTSKVLFTVYVTCRAAKRSYPLVEGVLGNRTRGASRRDEQPGREVQRHGNAPDECEESEPEPDGHDVNSEVVGDAGGNAGDHALVGSTT